MKNIKRNSMILAAILILTAAASAEQEMTVEDAVRIGLEHNFDIRIARNDARIAGNNNGKGTAGFLPTVDALANYSVNKTDQTSTPPGAIDFDNEGWNAQVSFNWTLFDGFKMFANKNRYSALAELGDYQTRNIIENTVVQISRAYFDLVQQEQLLDVARATVEISEQRFNREKVRNELGGASSTDLFNAQVSFNNDRATLLNQQLRVDVARQDLNILLGREPSTPLTVARQFAITPPAYEYDELLALTEEGNSILRLARLGKSLADHDVTLKRSEFLPRLSLNGSYGYSDRTATNYLPGFDEDIATEKTESSIGLVLSMNIFNGRRNWIDLQSARIEAKNRKLALDNTRNELAGQVRTKLLTFRQRLELMTLEESNNEAAQQNLQLQVDRFEMGVAGSLEFRDAQVSFERAQTTLIVARYQARIAQLEIEQLIGAIQLD